MVRLCSQSPTRAKLLRDFGIEFTQSKIDFNEESIKSTNAKEFVYSVVCGKLADALSKYDIKQMPILVADTVIELDKKILRKAKSKDEAREILLAQSGSKISIITATIMQSIKLKFIDISATIYYFDRFEEDALNSYLDSNLWQGKAGACMVEGFCKKYIRRVDGLESNAMGLPVEKIKPWLEF
jgi:septum formation protein